MSSRPIPPRLRILGLTGPTHGPFDLSLQRGECVVITGRSGSGKSVLLRMIADLDPHAGDAWIDGASRAAMAAPAWRRQVVYGAAESGWWDPVVGAHFAKPPPLDDAAALGLAPAIFTQEVRLCSTGERQRLALLRSLAQNAPVLLLDEPTGPLDPASVTCVEGLLQARLQAGGALLLVTHDPAQAARLGHRHFVMADGKLTRA
jgi:ABC-type iron transport system FetAB ATPase subunit